MGRLLVAMLACTLAGPALAGSSLLSGGTANWFYACANGEQMSILVRHRDQTTTQFSLLPGQTLRTPVRQGDVAASRCDGRFVPAATFAYIVTMP
jgi:hypothetical protein